MLVTHAALVVVVALAMVALAMVEEAGREERKTRFFARQYSELLSA